MINNVVLLSGVQQSDSVMHIQVSVLFQNSIPIEVRGFFFFLLTFKLNLEYEFP